MALKQKPVMVKYKKGPSRKVTKARKSKVKSRVRSKVRNRVKSSPRRRSVRRRSVRKKRKLIPKLKKGTLMGYSAKDSTFRRRKDLKRAIKKYGRNKIIWKLNAVYVLNKNRSPSTANVFKADRDWVSKTFKSPKRTSRRRKSRRTSRRRKSRRVSRRRRSKSRRRKSKSVFRFPKRKSKRVSRRRSKSRRRKSRRMSRRRRSKSRRKRLSPKRVTREIPGYRLPDTIVNRHKALKKAIEKYGKSKILKILRNLPKTFKYSLSKMDIEWINKTYKSRRRKSKRVSRRQRSKSRRRRSKSRRRKSRRVSRRRRSKSRR